MSFERIGIFMDENSSKINESKSHSERYKFLISKKCQISIDKLNQHHRLLSHFDKYKIAREPFAQFPHTIFFLLLYLMLISITINQIIEIQFYDS